MLCGLKGSIIIKKLYNWFAGIGFVKKLMQNGLFAKLLSYEVLSYLFFGVMTTVVNFLTYFVVDKIVLLATGNKLMEVILFTFAIKSFSMPFTMATIANIIAWVVSVAFAFVTNKLFVFESKEKKAGVVLKEIAGFVSGRLVSLVLFEVLLFTWICSLNLNEYVAKIIVAVLVVIFNYVISKLFIFKKDGGKNATSDSVESNK